MKTPPSQLLILALLATLPLASCRIVGTKPDFSGVADAFTPAQNDNVVIESATPVSTTTVAAPSVARPTLATAPPATPGSTATSTPATTPSAAGCYIVRRGDTLNAIARNHGVSLKALCAANGMADSSQIIRIGQVLRLPGNARATTVSPTSGGSSYALRAGDTLAAVARRHGISLSSLLKANGLTLESARQLRVGTVITIPTQH